MIILAKKKEKKGQTLLSEINGWYFSNPTKNAVESAKRKNIALHAACLITPGDFMIPGTICKDVSARSFASRGGTLLARCCRERKTRLHPSDTRSRIFAISTKGKAQRAETDAAFC